MMLKPNRWKMTGPQFSKAYDKQLLYVSAKISNMLDESIGKIPG